MSVGVNGTNAGYRGIADIGGTLVRFADANITARQEIEAPDLVMGDWDRDAYVYGKIEVGGSISGPVTETFLTGADAIILWAAGRGDPCGTLSSNDIKLYYYCGSARQFTGFFVNSFNFSVSAGEIAQFSLDVVGTFAEGFTAENPPHVTTSEKLITWDKVNVSITTAGDAGVPISTGDLKFSNFEFTVANNVETVYGLGQANLFPFDIIPGLRHISGSISIYNTPDFNGADAFEDYCAGNEAVLQFDLGSDCVGASNSVEMRVRFHRIEPTLSTSTIVSTLGFTGVTHQSGYPWDL